MRTLLEIIVVALLIALAWEKSFKDRLTEVPWIGDKISASGKPTRSAKRAHPLPSASPSGAWMWDPNRKTALDRPSPTPQPPAESTPN